MFIILFLSFCASIGAIECEDQSGATASEDVLNFDIEPSAMVGKVNVITGSYQEFSQDLVIPGPEPLVFQRAYNSSINSEVFKSYWSHNHEGFFELITTKPCEGIHTGAFGSQQIFMRKKAAKKGYTILCFDIKKMRFRLTNTSSGLISGKTNAKNQLWKMDCKTEESYLLSSNGGCSYFKKNSGVKSDIHNERTQALQWVNNPNGNKILYTYSNRNRLQTIATANAQDHVFASVHIDFPVPEIYAERPHCYLYSSDGHVIQYHFSKKTDNLEKFERSDGYYESYKYSEIESQRGLLLSKELPQQRFLSTTYYFKGNNAAYIGKVRIKSKDFRINRVRSQLAPVGTDSTPIQIQRFVYMKNHKEPKKANNKNYTEVHNAYNHKTRYIHDSFTLKGITHYNADQTTYRLEHFYRGSKKSDDSHGLAILSAGNLLARTICKPCGTIIAGKAYTYDILGNVLTESLFGQLTGEGGRIVIKPFGVPKGGDQYIISYCYSNDRQKNILEEHFPNGKNVFFSYKPNTDLVISRLTYDQNVLVIREFFAYDANAVLIESIRDDGQSTEPQNLAGVTQRTIIRTKPKVSKPCLGLPEEVTEWGFDVEKGIEVLVKKFTNIYDKFGHLCHQYHFDCNHEVLYELEWEYDRQGNVVKEKNALGETTTRNYDISGNLIYELGPDFRSYKSLFYDFMNRCIKEEVVYNNRRYTTSHSYDYLSNKVATVDAYGNETSFTYDVHSRLIEMKNPEVATSQKTTAIPVTHYTYDYLGYCTAVEDPRGEQIVKIYNLRGQPLKIQYPHGVEEHFTYTLEGQLKNSIEKNGNTTHHDYDFLGRLTKKTTYSKTGEFLSVSTAHYSAFHLIQEIDAAGKVVVYSYDFAGRLASKKCGNAFTTYHYDQIGRIHETRDWLDDVHYSSKVQLYDLLNRLVEERIEDEQGTVYNKIYYRYDLAGKQSAVISEGQAGLSITSTDYDVFGRPTLIKNADDTLIHFRYNDDFSNEFGQLVLQTTRIDPLGNQTVTTYDALNRISRITCLNSFGKKSRQQDVIYDLGNNKIFHEETVITPDHPDKQVITLCEYDASNHLIHHVEGAGSPEEKHTRWKYDDVGRLELLIKPDGTELIHQYDAFGYLKDYQASDGSFHYNYKYDAQGLPLEIEDTISGTKNCRYYNSEGRLEKEVLSNDIAINYTYDTLGRPLSITLPDESGLCYTYRGPYLHEAKRLDTDSQQKYKHTYLEHDLQGNSLREQLINGEELTHTYDLMVRQVANETASWKETGIAYDALSNLIQRKIHDSKGITPYDYRYDDLSQLNSEKGLTSQEYVHDSIYNRIQKNDDKAEFNAINQLLSTGSTKLTYSRNGNLITKGEESYVYDALDRLIKVTTPEKVIEYTYDSFNRRMSKIVNDGESLDYLYLGQNEVGASVKGVLKEFRVLGTGKGAEIGASISIEIDDDVYVPLHDHNGNVAALSNLDGSLIECYHYTGFGEESCYNEAGGDITQAKSPWRFSSKRVDAETGFLNFGRRCYDPVTARWITPDPIGAESGPNLYAYVFNNPLTCIDHYGLMTMSDVIINILHFVGSVIVNSSYHGIPCVILKDIFTFVGHLLCGNNFGSFIPSYREQHSSVGVVGDKDDVTQPIDICVNGILTTKKNIVDRAKALSINFGNKFIHYLHNATHGFMGDVIEWLGQRLGIPTNSAKKLEGMIRSQMAENPGRRIRLWLHSQGGEIGACLKNCFTPEELALIDVNTFGSANLFEKGYFGSVTHHVGTRDWVPLMGNPIQYLKASLGARSDVNFVKSNAWFFDHSYEDETYTRQLNKIILNIRTGSS